jgi:regulatory protein
VDVYTTALTLLSRRELSVRQLRERLARRKFEPEAISATIERLLRDRTLDDRRVAVAYARSEASIKGRGKRRVLRAVQHIGISADIAEDAVNEVFGELDETALFDRALEKRLKGVAVRDLDEKTRSRIIRQMVGQGFDIGRVMRMLRR